MAIDFSAAIGELNGPAGDGLLTLANESRTPAQYLLATILPERRRAGYEAAAGSMTIRTTMAGMVGMDSKYPEGGVINLNTFREQIAKLAIQNTLTEQMKRELRAFVERAVLDGGDAQAILLNTVLNFVNKLLLQPHYDREEWMRGQALFTGEIDWEYNGIELALDYGIPTANKFPTRTGTAAYGGSASVFWSDVRAGRRILKNNLRAIIGNSTTVDEVVYNDANNLEILEQTGPVYRIRRLVGSGVNQRPSTNAQETIDLISYDGEGEVFNPDEPENPTKVKFVPDGAIGLFARNDANREFEIGEGATPDPDNDVELGWTHLGPTEENNGRLGRFLDVYVPERMKMQLTGQAVSNSLPVVRNPDKIVLLSTDLS